MPEVEVLDASDPEAWEAAAALLGAGAVLGVPTDTVYGLAAHPAHVDSLFEVKGRDRSKPVALLVASMSQAAALVEFTDLDRRLAHEWWPGALTIVAVPVTGVDLEIGGDGLSVGVRCPADERLRALLDAVGPLAVSSANLSGGAPATTAGEVARIDGVGLVLDGGPLAGRPSTVVRGSTVLRAGPVDPCDVFDDFEGRV